MNKLLIILGVVLSMNATAATQNCGVVTINKVLAGPRHGAMMHVSNTLCGNSGWLCLDPNAEHMTQTESDRLFSFILSHKLASQQIQVYAYTDTYSAACGSYPVVEDVRSP